VLVLRWLLKSSRDYCVFESVASLLCRCLSRPLRVLHTRSLLLHTRSLLLHHSIPLTMTFSFQLTGKFSFCLHENGANAVSKTSGTAIEFTWHFHSNALHIPSLSDLGCSREFQLLSCQLCRATVREKCGQRGESRCCHST
jgi:hypothetical protein